uniref:Uncharacterized protein n=1 Tax=Anguilla anguilla TaxID=7936 RepID=A0A0E9SWD2_ANGAN
MRCTLMLNLMRESFSQFLTLEADAMLA